MPLDPKSTNGSQSTSPSAKGSSISSQFATALELPIIVVGAVLLGGVVGFYLDRWLHTKPYLLFIFGAMGFYGGIREVIRRTSGKT